MSEWMDELERLGELRDKGLITAEEFEVERKRILPNVQKRELDPPAKPKNNDHLKKTKLPPAPQSPRKSTAEYGRQFGYKAKLDRVTGVTHLVKDSSPQRFWIVLGIVLLVIIIIGVNQSNDSDTSTRSVSQENSYNSDCDTVDRRFEGELRTFTSAENGILTAISNGDEDLLKSRLASGMTAMRRSIADMRLLSGDCTASWNKEFQGIINGLQRILTGYTTFNRAVVNGDESEVDRAMIYLDEGEQMIKQNICSAADKLGFSGQVIGRSFSC